MISKYWVVLPPAADRSVRVCAKLAPAMGIWGTPLTVSGGSTPTGDYIVTINWLDHDKRKEEQVPDKLKGHHTNRQTSKLRIKVEAQTNELARFDLKE